jgi:hypothetical protein
MDPDHISETTTFVMWREERFCIVGVLFRGQISNFVSSGPYRWLVVLCFSSDYSTPKIT